MGINTRSRTLANAVNWFLIAWAAAQLVIGGLWLPEAWAVVAMAGGILLLPAAVFGLSKVRWVEPVVAAQLLLAAAFIAAAIVTENLSVGLAGMAILALVGSTMIVHDQLSRLTAAVASRDVAPGTSPSPATSSSTQTDHLLRQLYEATMLSDAAKRVLFRQRDVDAVRQAVQEEIARGAFDAASHLCDDLEMILDQGPMAQQLRAAIEAAQRQTHDDRFQSDLVAFDQMLHSGDWAGARQQADALHARYGDLIIDTSLHDRINAAQREHKEGLQQQFLHAASQNDLDRAMELLRLLDQYLTREEAEQLGEVAQNVIARQRDRLGREFQQAVNNHEWHEAARLGHAIITDFPNTKMADEVRSMIDLIRTRATEAAIASQSAR